MTERPNVLLIMTDQQKADTLGCYGNDAIRTPAIDRLASEGVRVDGYICNYPACTPARATVHTGRYTHSTRVRANHIHLPPREITLPAVLRSAGYETALIGKNHAFADGQPGSQFRDGALALRDWDRKPLDLAEDLRRDGLLGDQRDLFDVWLQANHFAPDGADHDELRRFSLQPYLWRSHAGTAITPLPPSECTTSILGAKAEGFVRERADATRPWFCWLSFPDPHNPYHAPEPYASMYDSEQVPVPALDDFSSKPERHLIAHRMSGGHNARESDVRRAIAMQWGQVTFIDAAVAGVMQALDGTGAGENTIVVFMTDHGGYVGDHGSWHKAPAFFDCLIRIPLIVRWPGTIAARELTDGFIEQVDVLPTLCSLCDVEVPPGVQGRSMSAALGGRNGDLRDAGFSEVGEAGDPVRMEDLPFEPDDPLDDRYFGWDGFQETWVGQGKMIRTPKWKYVWWADGSQELYDLDSDPEELVSVASRPEHSDVIAELKDRILTWTVTTEDQLPLHARNVWLDDVVHDRLPF